MLNNDFQVFWLGTLGGWWRHSLVVFFSLFFNLIGTTGVRSAILQEIEEGRQL